MWIYRRSGLAAAVIGLLVAGVDCSADDCFRYSDCAQGLTCAYGHCVVPAPPDAAEGGSVSTGDDGAASTESGTTSGEAARDGGSALGDDANPQAADAPAE